jgi:PAS domain S-box-containing protein
MPVSPTNSKKKLHQEKKDEKAYTSSEVEQLIQERTTELQKRNDTLQKENSRLREAEEALGAIRRGEVDAILVSTNEGEQVFTLKGAEYPYRVVIEQMQEGAANLADDGTILYCNASFARLLQVPLDEIIGRNIRPYILTSDWERFSALWDRSSNGGSQGEILLKARGNRVIPVFFSISPLQLEEERISSVVVTDLTEMKRAEADLYNAYAELDTRVQERTLELTNVNDQLQMEITERKRTEEALKEYAQKLKRSNEDLERFAYISSHDLQEPLRTMITFTQLLERRYKGKLDPDADEYIQYLVSGGKRMQALVQDLLEFSRVNTKGAGFRPTNATTVVDDALAFLHSKAHENGATITYDELPSVMADPGQLQMVFQNLISNAIKFRKPDVPPEIHISAQKQDGMIQFTVKDNGIGIEPQYFEKIFVIFQRLHGMDQYEGTGIGLAIVKRIIDRHGGRIWVESEPGKGSTFHFTVPAA